MYKRQDKMIAIINPDSAPVKRMIQNAKDMGIAIDATQGRRCLLYTSRCV